MSDGQDIILDNGVDEAVDSEQKRNERQTDSRLGEDVVVRKDFDSPQLHYSQNELEGIPPQDSEESDKPVPPGEGEQTASDDAAANAAVDGNNGQNPEQNQNDGTAENAESRWNRTAGIPFLFAQIGLLGSGTDQVGKRL